MNSPSKRIYRGVIYDRQPNDRNICHPVRQNCNLQSSYRLMYRGHTYWRDAHSTVKTNLKPVEYGLIYRGIVYRVSRNERGEMTDIKACTNFPVTNLRRNVSDLIQKILNKPRLRNSDFGSNKR